MDKVPINFAILSHWQNWVKVLLVVAIAAIAFDLLGRNLTFKKDANNG